MITYKLGAAGIMTSAYRLQFKWHHHIHPESSSSNDISDERTTYSSEGMITHPLRAAAVRTSAYRLQFRWHDHVQSQCGSSDDISVQIAIQMA